MSTKEEFELCLLEAVQYTDAITPTIINSGGCGFFAQTLANIVKEKRPEAQIKFICLLDERFDWEDESNAKTVQEAVEAKDFKKVPAQHVLLSIDGLVVDSEGLALKKVAAAEKTIEIKVEDMEVFLSTSNWNDMFDRTCLPTIESNLKSCLNVEKYVPNMFWSQYKKDTVKLTAHTRKHMSSSASNSFLSHLLSSMR